MIKGGFLVFHTGIFTHWQDEQKSQAVAKISDRVVLL